MKALERAVASGHAAFAAPKRSEQRARPDEPGHALAEAAGARGSDAGGNPCTLQSASWVAAVTAALQADLLEMIATSFGRLP